MTPGAKLIHDLPMEMLTEMIDQNSSLRGFIQGYAAEAFLMRILQQDNAFSNVEKIPDQAKRKGDIAFTHTGRALTMEVKSLKSRTKKEDHIEGGFSAVVAVSKTDRAQDVDGMIGTCHVTPGTFDILAISTYNVTGDWGFYFIANKYLPRVETNSDLIKTSFRVNPLTTPFLRTDLGKAIADLA